MGRKIKWLTQNVGFGFLIIKLLRSKGVKLRDGVEAHINAYLLRTKPYASKGKGETLTKLKGKAIEQFMKKVVERFVETTVRGDAEQISRAVQGLATIQTQPIPQEPTHVAYVVSENIAEVIARIAKVVEAKGAERAGGEAMEDNPNIQQVKADTQLTLQMPNEAVYEAMYVDTTISTDKDLLAKIIPAIEWQKWRMSNLDIIEEGLQRI
nr:uncharacterized protein LOC109167327 [Ipomoea batatas]